MKRTTLTIAAALVLLAGLAAVDWYITGGPITSHAVSRCYDAEEKRWNYADQPTRERERDGRRRCDDAQREGTLTLRGGIT